MALNFTDGASDRVQVTAAASINNLTAFSWEVWFYKTSSTPNGRRLVQKSTAGAALGKDLLLPASGADRLRFLIDRATTDAEALAATGSLTTNAWQYACAAYDEAAAPQLFIGSLAVKAVEPTYTTQTVGSGGTVNDSTQDLFIGNLVTVGGAPAGRIALVRLWNRRLTLAEAQMYQFRRGVPGTGCVGYYELGYNGTTNVPDLSGNGNAGAVTGATVADHVPLGRAFLFNDETFQPLKLTDYTVTAAQGTFTLAGVAAGLYAGRKVTASAGTFTLTGVAAGLLAARYAAASVGTFTLTGVAAGLKATRLVTAGTGSFTLAGVAAGLKATRLVSAGTGTFSLTGVAAGLLATRRLTADKGVATVTGVAASLTVARLLTAAVGVFTVTGQTAVLTYSGTITTLGSCTASDARTARCTASAASTASATASDSRTAYAAASDAPVSA